MTRYTKNNAIRNHEAWLKWRLEYLDANPGDYPLREDRPVVTLTMWPTTDWAKQKTFHI